MVRVTSPDRGMMICRRLRELKLTRAALAEAMDVSPARVTKICNGDDMLLSEANRLAEFLLLPMSTVWRSAPELHAAWFEGGGYTTEVLQYLALLSSDERRAMHNWMIVDFARRADFTSYPDMQERLQALLVKARAELAQEGLGVG